MRVRGLAVVAFLLVSVPMFAGRDAWTPLPFPRAIPSNPAYVVADPSDASNVFAFEGGSGSYRSADGGRTWTRITFDPSEPQCSSPGVVAVDTHQSFVLYAACGDDFPDPPFGRLLRSVDSGHTWRVVLESPTPIGPVVVSGSLLFTVEQVLVPLHPPVYSATLASSKDGGQSWSESLVGPVDVTGLAVIPGDPPTLLSSWFSNEPLPVPPQHGGVLRSTDGGATWVPGTGLPDAPAGPVAVDPFDADHAVVSVSASAAVLSLQLYESRDGGASWAPIDGAFEKEITALAFDASTPGRVFVATFGSGVFVSVDGGASWNPLNSGLTDLNVSSLAVSGERLYSGTRDGSVSGFDFVRLEPVPIVQSPPALIPGGRNLATPGAWGSGLASLATTNSGATLQILASGGCYGSYGNIGAPIPRGPFALAGTYTQLIGAYPGMIQYDASFSGSVAGNQMTITVVVPALQESFGPFDLTYGVQTSWQPCLYPGASGALRLWPLRR